MSCEDFETGPYFKGETMNNRQLEIVAQKTRDLAEIIRNLSGGKDITFSCHATGAVFITAHGCEESHIMENFRGDVNEYYQAYTAQDIERAREKYSVVKNEGGA